MNGGRRTDEHNRSLVGTSDRWGQKPKQGSGALHPLDLENQNEFNIRKQENASKQHQGVENSPRLNGKAGSVVGSLPVHKDGKREDRFD